MIPSEIHATITRTISARMEFLNTLVAATPHALTLVDELKQLEVAQFWLYNNPPLPAAPKVEDRF